MAKRKRIGRPPKPVEERKNVNFTFRSRGELRDWLRDAAAPENRSISEEIEKRLYESFQKQQAARDLAKALLEHFEERGVFDFAKKHIEGTKS
jgi:hypothetical protein